MQPSTDILELLTAVAELPSQQGPQATPVGEAGLSGTLFGDILGLLVSGKACQSDPSVIGAGLPEMPSMFLHGAIPFLVKNAAADGAEKTSRLQLFGAAVPGNEVRGNILPTDAIMTADSIVNLLECRSMQIEPGLYEILRARFAGGRLELEVRSSDSPTQPIRLSLPVGLLKNLGNGLNSMASGRVVLNQPGLGSDTPGFEELVTRLNLKTIEIRLDVSENRALSAKDSVHVKIVAGDPPNEFILREKLAKRSIRAEIEEKPGAGRRGDPAPAGSRLPLVTRAGTGRMTGYVSDHSSQNDHLQVFPRSQETAMKAGSGGKDLDGVDWLARMQMIESAHESQAVANTDADKGGLQLRPFDSRFIQSTVRFHLPDNIGQTLKPNGESILLQIEPDHLGPARLHLTMRGDLLSARVIVESVQALAAVEGSLDKLTEQLSRAGIEVDHIRVAVDGGDARNQFLDRRPDWNRVGRVRYRRDADSMDPVHVASTPAVVLRPLEYVNQNGVNLLA